MLYAILDNTYIKMYINIIHLFRMYIRLFNIGYLMPVI